MMNFFKRQKDVGLETKNASSKNETNMSKQQNKMRSEWEKRLSKIPNIDKDIIWGALHLKEHLTSDNENANKIISKLQVINQKFGKEFFSEKDLCNALYETDFFKQSAITNFYGTDNYIEHTQASKSLSKLFEEIDSHMQEATIKEDLIEFKDLLLSITGGSLEYNGKCTQYDDNAFRYKGEEIEWKDVKNIPLFPHEPNAIDVKQGNIGDCWFLAALSSIAAKSPSDIKKSMKDDGNGFVTVRLYQLEKEDFIPKYYKVKKSIAIASDNTVSIKKDVAVGCRRSPLWVLILEKALVMHDKSFKNESNVLDYLSIDGKNFTSNKMFSDDKSISINGKIVPPDDKLFRDNSLCGEYIITGKKIQDKRSYYNLIDPNNEDKLTLYNDIKKLTEENKGISGGTRQFGNNNGGLNGESKEAGMVATHGYSILGAYESGGVKYIIIRNPWGWYAGKYNKNDLQESPGKNFGIMKIKLEDYINKFSHNC